MVFEPACWSTGDDGDARFLNLHMFNAEFRLVTPGAHLLWRLAMAVLRREPIEIDMIHLFEGKIRPLPYALWSFGTFFSQHVVVFVAAQGRPPTLDWLFWLVPLYSTAAVVTRLVTRCLPFRHEAVRAAGSAS